MLRLVTRGYACGFEARYYTESVNALMRDAAPARLGGGRATPNRCWIKASCHEENSCDCCGFPVHRFTDQPGKQGSGGCGIWNGLQPEGAKSDCLLFPRDCAGGPAPEGYPAG